MNYKLSKLAFGLAAVLAISGQANASTFDLSFTGALTKPGSNDYSFTITSSSFDGYFATFTGPGGVKGLSASLLESGSPVSGLTMLSYPTYVELYTTTPLSAGTYDFKITGASAGSYTGGISCVTAVPEPSESALILTGVGMLGFIATRRKKS